jgi:hypothetical protein
MIEVTESENEEETFPSLMISDMNQVILATGRDEHGNLIGTNVNGKGFSIGYYSVKWCEEDFTHCDNKKVIELRNK